MKQSKILIVIDVSSKVEILDSAVFNRSLDFFTEETQQPKFFVVTQKNEDVISDQKISFEVKELEDKDAAKLLLLLASQEIEECNKDINTLANHKIFKLISKNPGAII